MLIILLAMHRAQAKKRSDIYHDKASAHFLFTHNNKHRLLARCIIYGAACYYQIMSTNQQTPSTNRSLIIIIAVIVIGAGWFVWQSTRTTNKVLDNTKKAQSSDKKTSEATPTDQHAGWKTYTWTSE